ncbi:zinc finger BED domain-containing protein RICESLEEPER 4-like [Lactuca sativa]|uniref:zinc finger BED domain-containing protein RICESLEEPER 4-like n=1 Tax=Lactuca sativa TaxID=4236 RepID=UPI000CD8A820|nr:zinc finger BED domain-containing protein RICESLEEPER 4-like [Lactuca sativa]
MEEIDLGSEQPSTPIGSTNVDVEHDNTNPNFPSFEEALQSDAVNPPNKRQKSIAWDQFVKVTVNGKLKAQCKTCNALLGADPKNGTKYLLVHREKCIAKGQTDIRQKLLVSNSKTDLSTYVYNEKDSRNALAKMVILHEYPLSIVEHVGFKNFTRTIQPLFKCPYRNTLKSDIKMCMRWKKVRLSKRLKICKVELTLQLICGLRPIKKTVHGYHRFVYVPCPHTSEVLTDVLIDALMEWNVDTKLSTITMDNCTKNDALIAYWTTTPKRVDTFESSCRQLKIPYSKKLGLDCPTRWNSTSLMLKVELMYKEVFGRLKQRDSQYKTLPKSLDWENAQEICGGLELFYNVTSIFSGTN